MSWELSKINPCTIRYVRSYLHFISFHDTDTSRAVAIHCQILTPLWHSKSPSCWWTGGKVIQDINSHGVDRILPELSNPNIMMLNSLSPWKKYMWFKCVNLWNCHGNPLLKSRILNSHLVYRLVNTSYPINIFWNVSYNKWQSSIVVVPAPGGKLGGTNTWQADIADASDYALG